MSGPWETSGVELPDELIGALEDDRLVIFAGAGVSQGPPANLPDFVRLAKEIASRAGLAGPEADEPLDVFLGDLEQKGVLVHDRARQILKKRSRRANEIHRLLVELASIRTPRIVTTNFDVNFERIFARLKARPEVFAGPALPLGNRFDGLVHIHGVLDKAGKSPLVLTDRDFGEAYLTSGWATRFLVPMFAEYTVLFVGYSAGDVTMRYLARSLPSRGKRSHFALVAEPELKKWTGLGMQTIGYSPDDGHRALSTGLSAWLRHASSSVADHNRRIKDVVEFEPKTMNPDDERFLIWACSRLETLRLFVQHADSVVWMSWMDEMGLLAPVFDDTDEHHGEHLALVGWIVGSLATDQDSQLLALLRRTSRDCPDYLWRAVLREVQVTFRLLDNPGPYVDWILSNSGEGRDASSLLDELVQHDPELAARLVEQMIHLRRRVKPAISVFPGAKIGFDLEFFLSGDEYSLRSAWPLLFPKLAGSADRIAETGLIELERASLDWATFHGGDRMWDPITGSRGAIEAHEQNYGHESYDLLIDIVRDLTRDRVTSDVSGGLAYSLRLLARPSSISKRIALDSLAEIAPHVADQGIGAIVDQNLLFRFGMKHEVFRVLRQAMPTVTSSVRDRLLDAALHSQLPDASDIRDYERFNLLAWLSRSVPDDAVISAAFADYAAAHTDFQVREYPDFDTWHSSADWEPHPEVPAEGKFIGKPYEAVLAERQATSDQDGLSQWHIEVSAAANASSEWSWGMLQSLRAEREFDDEVWRTLLRASGLGGVVHTSTEVTALVLGHPHLGRLWYEVEQLFEADSPTTNADILRQSDDLYQLWSGLPTSLPDEVSLSWAINQPRGQAAQMIIRLLAKLVETPPDEMPLEVRSKLEAMFSTASDGADATTLVLSSQVSWFAYIDRDWTLEVVIPTFSWSAEGASPSKAWAGFLEWGRWSNVLFETTLVEELRRGYTFVKEHIPRSLGRFTKHHAYMFREQPTDRMENWADDFLRAATDEGRAGWAHEVARSLTDNPEDASRSWAGLVRYWRRRIQSEPVALSAGESAGLFDWVLIPGIPFQEASDLFLQSPPPTSSWHIEHELEELPIERYPGESAAVILHVLSGSVSETRWDYSTIIEIARRIAVLNVEAARSLLLKLGTLGSAEALEVERRLSG